MADINIATIDYGAGNLQSVANAITRLGYQSKITSNPVEVLAADAVILPGVGAAANTMHSLKTTGMSQAILQLINDHRPLLAICIGMQIMMQATEEGGRQQCLGAIPGMVKKLRTEQKIPHMGWNNVKQKIKHQIFDGIPDEASFYFVHSYYVDPKDISVIAGTTDYGISFCSVMIYHKLIATQFHPEKSGEIGLKIYHNFFQLIKQGYF